MRLSFKTSLEEWKQTFKSSYRCDSIPFKTSLEEWKQRPLLALRAGESPFKTSLEEWKRPCHADFRLPYSLLLKLP